MSYKNSKKQNVSLKGNAEEMVSTFVSDPNVQDDIVFRLGLLSAFTLICSGLSKNDIKRIEMMQSQVDPSKIVKIRTDLFGLE